MGAIAKLGRVFGWVIVGMIIGIVVAAPFADIAARYNPVVFKYKSGVSFDHYYGPPSEGGELHTMNLASSQVMMAGLGTGVVVGLLIGLSGRRLVLGAQGNDPQSNHLIRNG